MGPTKSKVLWETGGGPFNGGEYFFSQHWSLSFKALVGLLAGFLPTLPGVPAPCGSMNGPRHSRGQQGRADDGEGRGLNLDLQSPLAYFYIHFFISSPNSNELVPGTEIEAHGNPGTSSWEGWSLNPGLQTACGPPVSPEKRAS